MTSPILDMAEEEEAAEEAEDQRLFVRMTRLMGGTVNQTTILHKTNGHPLPLLGITITTIPSVEILAGEIRAVITITIIIIGTMEAFKTTDKVEIEVLEVEVEVLGVVTEGLEEVVVTEVLEVVVTEALEGVEVEVEGIQFLNQIGTIGRVKNLLC